MLLYYNYGGHNTVDLDSSYDVVILKCANNNKVSDNIVIIIDA